MSSRSSPYPLGRARVMIVAAMGAVFCGALPGAVGEKAVTLPDPTTIVWSAHPAEKWENAFPIGNGRLGAMIFGKTDEERIQLSEETYWSGGRLKQATILSTLGGTCRIRAGVAFVRVASERKEIRFSSPANGAIEFKTDAGGIYILTAR